MNKTDFSYKLKVKLTVYKVQTPLGHIIAISSFHKSHKKRWLITSLIHHTSIS